MAIPSIVRNTLYRLKNTNTEDLFYRNLFIHSGYWNKPWPNEEEMLRWLIIRDFIETLIIKDFRNHDREQFSILDVGCGRGWLSNLCMPYGSIKAIEPVKSVSRYGKKLFPNLDISSQSINDLIVKKYKYDLIICSEVIEHIPDASKSSFVANLKNLLRDDGHIVITTPRKEVLSQWQQYSNPNQPTEDWLSESEISSLFSHFTVIKKENLSIKPIQAAPEIPVYQLWLFQKK